MEHHFVVIYDDKQNRFWLEAENHYSLMHGEVWDEEAEDWLHVGGMDTPEEVTKCYEEHFDALDLLLDEYTANLLWPPHMEQERSTE